MHEGAHVSSVIDAHRPDRYVSPMSVKSKVVALSAHGRVLGTRELGSQLADEVRKAVASAADTVLIDFGGVEVASSPVLDEIACALRAAIADHPGRFVVLTRLNDDVQDTLELVLERRDMSLGYLRDKELELLGGRQHLEETLAQAQDLETFTAAELAERLKVKLPNLHQRLNQLQAAGVVARTDPTTGGSRRAIQFATPRADDLATA